MDAPLSREALGQAGLDSAERRGRGCARPVQLVGSTVVVNKSTGEVGHRYSASQELDGTMYVRCGNRRAEVCPSCSAEYKGDAWHLILCGLAGGKGIPESVAHHPCT
ncbi:MAG TPA: replication initiator, partial [Nocardioidaceae bacterium]|nr:replication initiator [Nocardioidaceae bacterium]